MRSKPVKQRLKSLSSRQKASTLMLIAVLVVASILSVYFKISLSGAKNKDAYDEREMKDLQWKHIENSLEVFIKDAELNSDLVAQKIKMELQAKVNSGEFQQGFTKEEKSLKELSRLSSEILKDSFLNDVRGDKNGVYIATKERVVSDLSLACAVDPGEQRDWESEISRHYNRELAEQAVESILKQRDGIIFNECLVYTNDNHEKIKTMSIDSLKKAYFIEGLEGLRHYSFLVPAYIEEYGDILKSPDITPKGERVDNDKIIVIQRFNLVEQIENNKIKSSYLEALKNKEAGLIRDNEHETMSRISLMIGIIGIFIVFSLSLMFYVNAVISKEND